MIDGPRWDRVKAVFQQVLDRPAHERAGLLRELCDDDRLLLAEVESLLATHEQAGSFAEQPAKELLQALGEDIHSRSLASVARVVRPGDRLGVYEIQALLGAGGMGEVYCARDVELARDVAIKVLPGEFTADRGRLARFEREARILASLNHPNIAAIYGLERAGDSRALVLELVDGETLAERIAAPGSGLPMGDVLAIGRQIAAALGAAHDKGIVHRDLKPANIKITAAGVVKVLDFGLAKAGGTTPDVSGSPTVTIGGTRDRVLLGTAAYMSPEQVRGQVVDKRCDVWAFGCVLFEMLTGRQAFAGETFSDIVAAVLRGEPEWAALPRHTPQRILDLLRRCLRQDVERRLHSVDDARLEIEEALSSSTVRSRRATALVVGTVTAVLVIAFAASLIVRRDRSLLFGDVTPFTAYVGVESEPAFSPDGTRVAFVWDQGSGRRLYVKLVGGEDQPLALTTTPGVSSPTWSPDGRQLAFLRSFPQGVFVIPALGGIERHVVATNASSIGTNAGLAWTADGRHLIVVDKSSPEAQDGLFLFSLETGEKRQLTGGRESLRYGDSNPVLSPDGRSIAFIRRSRSNLARDLYLTSVDGGEIKALTRKGWEINGLDWTANGKAIVFAGANVTGNDRLWSIPASGGEPSALAVGEGAVQVSIARTGEYFAYARLSSDVNIWRTDGPAAGRRGPPEKFVASTRNERYASYSPDARRLAFQSNRFGPYALWVCEADGTRCSELTTIGNRMTGPHQWSPDSQWIAFTHAGEPPGNPDICLVRVDGGVVRTLIDGKRLPGAYPSWSPDGRWIYFNGNPPSGQIWKVPANEAGAPQIVATVHGSGTRPTPDVDGRYIYYSKASGPAPVWRVELETGRESPLIDAVAAGGWTFWRRTLVYGALDDRNRSYIAQLDLDKGTTTELISLDGTRFDGPNLSVSPDGRWILYGRAEETGDIMLVRSVR